MIISRTINVGFKKKKKLKQICKIMGGDERRRFYVNFIKIYIFNYYTRK